MCAVPWAVWTAFYNGKLCGLGITVARSCLMFMLLFVSALHWRKCEDCRADSGVTGGAGGAGARNRSRIKNLVTLAVTSPLAGISGAGTSASYFWRSFNIFPKVIALPWCCSWTPNVSCLPQAEPLSVHWPEITQMLHFFTVLLTCSFCWVEASSSLNHVFSWHSLFTWEMWFTC